MGFETMISETKQVLEKNLKNDCMATALFTDKENIYVICCNTFNSCCKKIDEDYSLNDLIKTGETRVLKMITMFKQGDKFGINVPCAWLCRFIYDMNNENINVEVRLADGRSFQYLKEFAFE